MPRPAATAFIRARVAEPSSNEFVGLLRGWLEGRLPPGCDSRHAYVGLDAPDAYCLVEHWADPVRLREHRSSDLHRALRGGLRALGVLVGDEVVLDAARLEPAGGAAPPLVELVSHDLRSPLTSVGALLTLVQDRLAREPGLAAEAEDLRLALGECRRLAAMIADLAVVSRIQRRRLHADRAPVALRELLEEVARVVEPRAAACGAVVDLDLARAPRVASLDGSLVHRLVDNLVSNALRHVRRGDRIQLAAEADGDRVRLAVRNTGPEVPGHVHAVLEGEEPAEGGGARRGLGLYICRLVAEAHGGVFSLVPRAGWTVSFEALLPDAPSPRSAP